MILTYSAHYPNTIQTSLESRGPVSDECRADLLDTVGKRELELGDHQLLDVRAANVVGLLDLDDAENLHTSMVELRRTTKTQQERRDVRG